MGNRIKLAVRPLALGVLVSSFIVCAENQNGAFNDDRVPNLEPLAIHPRTSLTIVDQIRHNHFVKKPLDDAASSEIFDKYVNTLDPGHAYYSKPTLMR